MMNILMIYNHPIDIKQKNLPNSIVVIGTNKNHENLTTKPIWNTDVTTFRMSCGEQVQ